MRSKRSRRCPILVDIGQKLIKTRMSVSNTATPADIAISIRENGWHPYKVRFDTTANVWIVSSLEGLGAR
jgi:hypothetical protein